jgi:hypothetical protein
MTRYPIHPIFMSPKMSFFMYAIGAIAWVGMGVLWFQLMHGRGGSFLYVVLLLPVLLTVQNGLERRCEVDEIRVTEDGLVTLVCGFGIITVAAEDIRELQGAYCRDPAQDDPELAGEYRWDTDRNSFGRSLWYLSICYVAGDKKRWLRCDQFAGVTEFVDQVRTHNPSVDVTGLWPITSPLA